MFTAAIATAVVILTYFYEPRTKRRDTGEKKLVRPAHALIGSVVLLVVYMM